MYAKRGNLIDADAYGAESRLEIIQGHAFWDHWKADCVLLYNNVGFRVGNFDMERSGHLFFREPHCHSAPPFYGTPANIRTSYILFAPE